MTYEELKQELDKPLDAKHVKTRKQGGGNVSYVDGHHVISEANRIFGHLAWDRVTTDVREVQCHEVTKDQKTNWYVGYTCKVAINVYHDGSITVRQGTGFGQGIDRDLGKAHESAIKEAETDAMKRALMTFGNTFGLALYDKSMSNVVATPEPYVFPLKGDILKKAKDMIKEAGLEWNFVLKHCEDNDFRTVKEAGDAIKSLVASA